jgi:hypothetical protein
MTSRNVYRSELPPLSTGKVQKFGLREREWGGRAKRIS